MSAVEGFTVCAYISTHISLVDVTHYRFCLLEGLNPNTTVLLKYISLVDGTPCLLLFIDLFFEGNPSIKRTFLLTFGLNSKAAVTIVVVSSLVTTDPS